MTLLYENNPEMIRTLNAILSSVPQTEQTKERIQYHDKLLNKIEGDKNV